ncbi:MAG: AI-2E family transporter [Cyclobacteriaceae bacterium]
MSQQQTLDGIRTILRVFLAILILYLVKVLSNLLVPLAFAIFLAVLFQPLVSFFRKKLSLNLSVLITTLLFISIFLISGLVFFGAVRGLINNSDTVFDQFNQAVKPIIDNLGYFVDDQFLVTDVSEIFKQFMPMGDLVTASGTFLGSMSGFAAEILMIILYFAGLLGAISQIDNTVGYILKDRSSTETAEAIKSLKRIKDSVSIYIKVKSIVSLMTGFGVGVICWAFGIQYAMVWGLLAFVLNYIPYIGSLFAIVPPLLIGAVTLNSVGLTFLLFVLMEGVQLVMGNVVEPRMMGKSLSINVVTVLFGFVFWAFMWDLAGMLLAVPLTFLVKVTLEHVSGADILVRLMEEKNGDQVQS